MKPNPFLFNKDIDRAQTRLERLGPLIKYRNQRRWALQELAKRASDRLCPTEHIDHIVETIWTESHKATRS